MLSQAIAIQDAPPRRPSSPHDASPADGAPLFADSLFAGPLFAGRVEHGEKFGRTLGFPTANVALQGRRPAAGIYAAIATLDDGVARPAVAYYGRRPTVGGEDELLETFIFNFEQDIYGRRLTTELVSFIRPDKHFPDIPAMQRQILLDCRSARFILDVL